MSKYYLIAGKSFSQHDPIPVLLIWDLPGYFKRWLSVRKGLWPCSPVIWQVNRKLICDQRHIYTGI